MEISIREYKQGDEAAIFKLYQKVSLQQAVDFESWYLKWKWEFLDGPYGKARIWLAVDGERIVGEYPVLFSKIKISNAVHPSALNVDLMTDPDYQRRGIFQRLEHTAIEELTKAKVRFLWGYPNKAAMKGHLNSGWKRIDQYSFLIRILNPFNSISASSEERKRRSIGGSFVRMARFDDECKDLIDGFTESKDLIMVRELPYLNWRYSGPDGYKIYYYMEGQRVGGYLVYRIINRGRFKLASLEDVVYANQAALESMIRCFFRLCSMDNAVAAIFPALVNESELKQFLRAGFYNYVFKDDIILCGIMLPKDMDAPQAVFNSPHFTIGDGL
jgi:GNAT superfamily N-acetyltransferase